MNRWKKMNKFCSSSAVASDGMHDIRSPMLNNAKDTASVITTENRQLDRVTCFEGHFLYPMMSFTKYDFASRIDWSYLKHCVKWFSFAFP